MLQKTNKTCNKGVRYVVADVTGVHHLKTYTERDVCRHAARSKMFLNLFVVQLIYKT